MARSKLLLLVAFVAVVAGAGWLLWGAGGDGPSTEPIVTPGEPGAVEPGPGGGAALPTDVAPPEEAGESRSAVVEAAMPVEGDPEIQAALAGFTGRVLHADGRPVDGTLVVLYLMDPMVLIGENDDLFAPEILDPNIDAGEDVTDADGRFAIHGVWPQSLYLLHAGVDSDNPTARVIENTPGSGEIVDLGDIYLRDGATVIGTVVGEDGEPVAGALVRVLDLPGPILEMVPLELFDPEGAILVHENSQTIIVEMPPWAKRRFDQLPIPTTTSEEDGSFRVTGIEPGQNVLLVTATGHASLQEHGLRLAAGEEHDAGTLELEEGEIVRGKVTDTAGHPIAGAEVIVGQAGAVGVVHFAPKAFTTDEDGKFSQVGFGYDGDVMAAARRRPGDPWASIEPQAPDEEIHVTLAAGHALTLRLTSATSLPITEPRFRLLPGSVGDGAVELARFGFSGELDLEGRLERLDDGRHRIGDVPAGQYTLLVQATGHALRGARLALNADTDETIELDPEVTFKVRVEERDGKPIRSASIYVEARRPDRRTGDMPVPRGRTGNDGVLAVSGVSAGEVRVSANHPKYGWSHTRAEVPGADVLLTFDTPGHIEGILTDDGEVPEIGKWTIVASRRGQRGPMPDLPRLAVGDLEGNFKITGLQPGEYELDVMESFQKFASPGSLAQGMMGQAFFDQNETKVMVVAGQTSHVALDAVRDPGEVEGPSARVTGTVTLNGRAAEGMALTGWGSRSVSGRVEASGTFDLGQVAEGHLYLRLVDPDTSTLLDQGHLWSRSLQIEAGEDVHLDIVVQTSELVGTVRGPDEKPVKGAQVRIDGVLGQEGDPDRGNASFRTVTDADGEFRFEDVPHGTYQLEAEHDRHGRATVSAFEIVAQREEVEVALQPTVRISGNIDMSVFGNESPENMWLGFQRETANGTEHAGWARVTTDGSFKSEPLVPGTYRGQVWASSTNSQQEYVVEDEIVVGDEDAEGLTLRLKAK